MKTKLINLFEYEISKENELGEKELKEIRKLNKFYFPNSNSKDGESGILNLASKDRVKATQFVGVIQIRNKTIEILPKIFSKKEKIKYETKDEQSKIKKNLLFMLSYTKKLKIKETDISSLSKNDNLFESIIYLFAKNLIELLKKDLIKNYETREENTNFLKGKLLMTKHLKYNLFNKAKFYSQFDEFTEDNLLNQVFKATVNKLIKFTNNSKNFKLLSECDLILQDVSLKIISINDIERIKFNRLNLQYEHIFNLAKLLLFGNSIELNSKSTKTYSLMFDMNKLFEEFIFEFIKRNCNYNDDLIRSENPKKYLFEKSPRFQLKPDITFYNKDKDICKLIIDTKYKKTNDNSSDKYGISTSDMYQMFTYSKIYQCKNIILLYPEFEKKLNNKFDFISDEFNVFPRTVNLHLDLLKDKKKLKEELNNILDKFYNNKNLKIIETELKTILNKCNFNSKNEKSLIQEKLFDFVINSYPYLLHIDDINNFFKSSINFNLIENFNIDNDLKLINKNNFLILLFELEKTDNYIKDDKKIQNYIERIIKKNKNTSIMYASKYTKNQKILKVDLIYA